MTDDPDFFAWLDGELPEPKASSMAAKVAADPELAAFADQHRALAGTLSAAFAPVLAAPIPDRLRKGAEPRSAEIVQFAEVRARRRQWNLAGLAAAASLALGLALGIALPRDGGSFRSSGGQLAAAGALDTALDRQLAAVGERDGIRMGVSFKDQEGRYCRSFAANTQSGLACRSGDQWLVEGLVKTGREQGEFRMAAGQDPGIAAMVDGRIAGEPLGPEAEAQAIEGRWRD